MAGTPLATMALDAATWDLVVDSSGNPLILTGAAGLAQDAASAIRTFLGEYFWDTTVGVPYLTQILGPPPPSTPVSLALLKQQLIVAALTVPGVASAQVYISALNNRSVSGQVQVSAVTTGETAAANFTVMSPQGSG